MSVKNWAIIVGFLILSVSDFVSVTLGFPTSFFSPTVWRAWVDVYKGAFGVMLSALVWLTSSTTAKIYSPHENMSFKVKNGLLRTILSPRAVVIANHQIYSDWIYLWWFSYTADLHSGIIFSLKKSLRNIPIFGWGMRWFKFLFLSRSWAEDEPHIKETTKYLAKDPNWPVWVCLFPEGTVINSSTSARAEQYAVKTGIPKHLVPKHVLLPRVKGLQSILTGLKGSISVLYDLTVVYETQPPNNESAESYFSLGRSFVHGKGPRVVNIYIREFPMNQIPYEKSEEAFSSWLYERWAEKDNIYADLVAGNRESELKATAPVRPKSLLELYSCVNVPLTLGLLTHLVFTYLIK